MKYKILFSIATAGLFIFSTIGLRSVVHTRQKIQVQKLELRSKDTEVKTLQLKLEKLNTDLDGSLKSDKINAEKVQEIEKQKQDLDKQIQDLQEQVSLKKQQNQTFQTATAYAASLPAGSHIDWMTQAGIAEGDFGYVDYIVNHEGGWGGTMIWNHGGSGAYGLCQALPASKMASAGADYMTNPITQLRWCSGYAQGRYGGWAGAYQAWINQNWW